ncbi:glycosyltransferase [Methylomagnum sp.]
MKVLMTTDAVSGIWQYTMELARGLLPYGVEIALVVPGVPMTDGQRAEAYSLPNIELFESPYQLVWMDDPWRDVPESGEWLLNLACRWKPELVHLNDYPHGALPWQVPVLMVAHFCVLSWWQAARHQRPPAAWKDYRDTVARGLAGAGRVVVPTATMLESLRRFCEPLPPTCCIPCGRRPALIETPSKEPFILATGRVGDEARNIPLLARSALGMPWPVCIAGETQGQAPEFANVHWLGSLAPAELADWRTRAAIYALPARCEPFGLSVLEAALAGCALVLGDIPSLREVWGEAALYVNPDDGRGLRAVVRALASDAALRLDYAERARVRAARFTPQDMAAGYWKAYTELAGPEPYPYPMEATPMPPTVWRPGGKGAPSSDALREILDWVTESEDG